MATMEDLQQSLEDLGGSITGVLQDRDALLAACKAAADFLERPEQCTPLERGGLHEQLQLAIKDR